MALQCLLNFFYKKSCWRRELARLSPAKARCWIVMIKKIMEIYWKVKLWVILHYLELCKTTARLYRCQWDRALPLRFWQSDVGNQSQIFFFFFKRIDLICWWMIFIGKWVCVSTFHLKPCTYDWHLQLQLPIYIWIHTQNKL